MKNFIPMVVASCAALLTACVSAPIQLSSSTPAPAGTERTIEAKSCGFQLLLILPLGINGRHERAHQSLLRQAGKDYIKDVRVEESWSYGFVGTLYCTRFIATAVRPSKTVVRKTSAVAKPKSVEAAPVIAAPEQPVAVTPETPAVPVAESAPSEAPAALSQPPPAAVPEPVPVVAAAAEGPFSVIEPPAPAPVAQPLPPVAPVPAPVSSVATVSGPALAVSADVRSHPNHKARVLKTLPAGTSVKWGLGIARSPSGNWTYIEAGDTEGWVPESAIRK